MSSGKDTIYALATPTGRSGVAMIRLSGARAGAAIERLTDQPLPPPRRAVLRALYMIRENETGKKEKEIIDHALILYFASPQSFTGEDVAEFHIHGGPAVVEGLLTACGRLGLRAAEAGEFSRRAFLNGRSDLAEVEGLADLIAAETAAQRRQALRQLGGEMSAICEDWRERLLGVLAQAEAGLDFPDEAADEAISLKVLLTKINAIDQEIKMRLEDRHCGERLRLGVRIAIIGAPNVGKSTLLNLLAGREAAIVSARAGTTRDVLEVALDLGGWPVVVSDMAGLREAQDEIEAEGVRRARMVAEQADLRVVMLAPDVAADLNDRVLSLRAASDLVIVNKTDLSCGEEVYSAADLRFCLISEDRSGFNLLVDLLTQRAARLCGENVSPLITRARHRDALRACHEALSRACRAEVPELLAEDLRLATTSLGRITGRVGVEDMLDKLFAEFCIGK